jgi:serine/threonine protein kinase
VPIGSGSTREKVRSLPVKVTSGAQAYAPEPLVVPFAQGDVIADKYEVVGLLGAGGVAYVLSALHLELHEMVAIKFLRPESLEMADVVARFASEARAVAKLKSEHVAHVFDVGSLPDGAPYIVMEYLEGRDLADVLAEQRRLPPKVAVDYVLQACEALACAHALGMVHRDIKPENLYLSQAGSVETIKVLDFGISKIALAAHQEATSRETTKTMLPMGTPGYMSPEQVRACGSVDARTDIWALGCVLSELITGTSAFEAPTQVQLGAVILEADPVPLRQKIADAPAELEAIVMRCLAKNPDDRFRDVAELALALYPFGRRRARLSAERCHQILHGAAGGEIELNSVPPPQSGDTPLRVAVADVSDPPRSGRIAVGAASAAPVLTPGTETFSTKTPGAMSSIDVMPGLRPRKRWPLVALLVVGLAAAAGVALRLRGNDAPVALGADSGATAARGASTTGAASTATAPTPAAAPERPASADQEPLIAGVANGAKPAPTAAPATAPGSKASQSAAQRAAAAASKRQAAAAAAKAAKTKAAAKRATALDDSEPDVGY